MGLHISRSAADEAVRDRSGRLCPRGGPHPANVFTLDITPSSLFTFSPFVARMFSLRTECMP